jgi:hypothetical protein
MAPTTRPQLKRINDVRHRRRRWADPQLPELRLVRKRGRRWAVVLADAGRPARERRTPSPETLRLLRELGRPKSFASLRDAARTLRAIHDALREHLPGSALHEIFKS